MKCLTQAEKQAVISFLEFLNTKEDWHIPSLTAHLSCCASRMSILLELANQIEMDTYVYPNVEASVFHLIGVGDLYTPTLIFDHVRNLLVFACEGNVRDELKRYGYEADPVYPLDLPLPCVLSEGTCKLSDILPIAFDALSKYDPDRANEIALDLYKGRVDLSSEDLDPNEASFWYEEIEFAINSACSLQNEKLYFGTHEFDPACLGIWHMPDEDQADSE